MTPVKAREDKDESHHRIRLTAVADECIQAVATIGYYCAPAVVINRSRVADSQQFLM